MRKPILSHLFKWRGVTWERERERERERLICEGKIVTKYWERKEGERRKEIIVIFAHPLETIFQIATADSFTVGSGWFLDSRFYTWYFKLSGWIVRKISREGDKYFTFSTLHFGVSSSYLFIVSIGALFWFGYLYHVSVHLLETLLYLY